MASSCSACNLLFNASDDEFEVFFLPLGFFRTASHGLFRSESSEEDDEGVGDEGAFDLVFFAMLSASTEVLRKRERGKEEKRK